MWKGSNRFPTPMLFAVGTVFVFGLGGLTGLYLGTIATDIYLHDTMWVVGHFHLTMAAAAFLGSFAGLYYWFPKMFGRQYNETLGKVHFWGSVTFITLVFTGQLIVGFAGQQRRLYDPYQYTFLQHLLGANRLTSYAAFLLAAFQVPFIYNFLRSVFAGPKAEQNPWEATTIEWTHAASPPPHHNYDPIPTILRGPHELANPEVKKLTGRDWAGQAEELPSGAEAPAKTVVPQGA